MPEKKSGGTRGVLGSLALWGAAILLTGLCFVFQNRTGPTYPLTGTFPTARGPVAFTFLRSEEIGKGLAIVLKEPMPRGLSGTVRWRRYKSPDQWTVTPMQAGRFTFVRRGKEEHLAGLGTLLPSLPERAGKYEYFVLLDDGSGPVSVTGEKPVYARYKAPVPRHALLPHILMIFLSMTLALRTALQALSGGRIQGLLWATLGSLFLGAFVLGPWVQWYAFGVWWSGVPFGWDWTDNKVLVELVAWIPAVLLARNPSRLRPAVLAAALVTLAVYFIPHSVFGSEYDYTKGSGQGTAGKVNP